MSGQTLSTSATRIEALTLQSSSDGVVIPLVYGLCRVPGNLLWTGSFKGVPHTTTQGGKGGVTTQNTTYTYVASLVMGLCRGSISGIPTIWRGKSQFTGGWLPTQVTTVTETYTPPGSGAMTYALANAATYLSMVRVQVTAGRSTLSDGGDYTMTAGVMTILTDRWRSVGLSITYQYASGTQGTTALQQVNLSFYAGALGQPAWSYLSSFAPPGGAAGAQLVHYSGVAFVTGLDYDLGTSAQVENHSFEVQAPMAYHLGSSVPDVDPALVLQDVLSNASAGANFPASQLDSWTEWSDFCVASQLLISPAITKQSRAADVVDTMAKLGNAGPVWSGGRLKMVPYGDSTVTANGRTFTPNSTPVYDLDDESWSAAASPLKCTAKSPADRYNHVRVQYSDRGMQYNPAIAEAKDQADIDAYGLRSASVLEAPWICAATAARQVAQLVLQRSLFVVNSYEATLPWHYALLEPMDLVTLTDSALGLVQTPARVLSISENTDGDLQVTFEDYPAGVSSAAIYPSQAPAGYRADYNASPGSVDAPTIFEAPADLTGTGLEVYAAVRGSGANWGGCQVWVSLDGTYFRQMGVIYGGARYGTLSTGAAGGATSIAVTGLGSAQLISGSAADASQLSTLCYVGGANPEYLAYQTATLTGAGAYTLSALVHAAYGTTAAAHSSGAPFVRVDERIAKSGDLDISYIGKTLSFKFTSFNTTGGGQQGLADVSAYTYTITGAMAALRPGWAGKGLTLVADSLTFAIASGGAASPAGITLTALLKGILSGTITFTVQAGTCTLVGTGNTRTIAPASMTTQTVTISAAVSDAVGTYTDYVTISKVVDGSPGLYALRSPCAWG